MSDTGTRRIAIIGAGFIASAHLAALRRRKDIVVNAIVDPVLPKAEALAASVKGARAFSSTDALIERAKPDAAHILTPPPLHASAAEPLLKAGVDVLLEKPMAETAAQCDRLINAAENGGAALLVNHNFAHHPSFLNAARLANSGRFGPVRSVQMRYAAPLRQMAARQFGHWMFNRPRNLLLEQAVHPLSQIDELLGGIVDVGTTPGPVRRPAEGIELVTDWLLDLVCRDGLAQLHVELGASFPSWTMTLLCDDGAIDADIFEGRVIVRRPHAAIAPIDFARRNLRIGFGGLAAGAAGIAAFTAELSRLGPPADGFSRSMTSSIGAFYDALAEGEKPRPEAGRRLVEICERAAVAAVVAPPAVTRKPAAETRYDVAVLGGTGFIGQHLVRLLIDAGASVAVMGRNTANLPALFHKADVGVFRGSIGDKDLLSDLAGRARQVVNLAHGGGGVSREAIAEAMVGGARNAVTAALDAGVERILHISSSAALYLGDAAETITMATPPDERPDERADYARAKILAEMAMREYGDAPIAVLRPAVVVGEGGTPFHSALGAFENETHCLGWNAGRNPLPFVLAEDVAAAIAAALAADISAVRGKAFNIVGDVRWSARRYIEELAGATMRPLRHHPSSVAMLAADEWLKWAVKKIAGRRGVAKPSTRDIRSRGMVASFDISEEKRLLSWRPCQNEKEFLQKAIMPHGRIGT